VAAGTHGVDDHCGRASPSGEGHREPRQQRGIVDQPVHRDPLWPRLVGGVDVVEQQRAQWAAGLADHQQVAVEDAGVAEGSVQLDRGAPEGGQRPASGRVVELDVATGVAHGDLLVGDVDDVVDVRADRDVARQPDVEAQRADHQGQPAELVLRFRFGVQLRQRQR
jgi:hypothetical protein